MSRKDVTLENLKEIGKGCLPDYLGIEMLEVQAHGMKGRMAVTPHHFAPNGYVHAASIVALADTTCGYATLAHLPAGAISFTTLELKSNHVGTVKGGTLACQANAQHLGRSTQVWDAVVSDEESGKTIALFRCTQMILWPKDASGAS